MTRRFSYQLILATMMLTWIGCGRVAVPMSDPHAAKQLLSSALEAWKTGKSVADMRQSTPPVYVAEELWNDGFQLTDFVIEGDGEMYGPSVRLHVTLVGSGTGSSVVEKRLQYLVTTTPAFTIARADP